MLEESQIASVITHPVRGGMDASTVEMGLSVLIDLPIARTFLVFDRKSAVGAANAPRLRATWGPRFAERGRRLITLETDEHDTAPRWRRGIIEAFHDPVIQSVVLCPGDIVEPPGDSQIAGWRNMIRMAGPHVLVIGDYRSKDAFKTRFDALIAYRAISILFPSLMSGLASLGQSKLRTEFLAVGRDLFQLFDREAAFAWGTDPTVQVALFVLERGRDVTIERVNLGGFEDSSDFRTPQGQMYQICRFASEMLHDRLHHEQRRDFATAEERIRAYDQILGTIEELFAATVDALRTNLDCLAAELAGKRPAQQAAQQAAPAAPGESTAR